MRQTLHAVCLLILGAAIYYTLQVAVNPVTVNAQSRNIRIQKVDVSINNPNVVTAIVQGTVVGFSCDGGTCWVASTGN